MLRRTLLSVSLIVANFAAPVLAAFGVTESGDSFIVDTAGGLVFTVEKTSGDVTPVLFNGIQAQDQSKRSHIAFGISATCTWTQISNYIKIPCVTNTLTHYYVAQYKNPGIHMATYTTAEPSVGELPFVARLNEATLPNGPIVSPAKPAQSFIDDQVHEVTGSGIGAYMVIPGTGYEASSGGPFFRDIDNQDGGQQKVYFYMNSGHTQTESYRMGLHGPYLLQFTTGAAPSSDINLVFWDGLGVTGWVSLSGRGYIKGKASGASSAFASLVVVGWSNSQSQYWDRAESNGNFYSPAMKPGTYTMTMYMSELAVVTASVTVAAGSTITNNIQSQEIGDFDGTPRGFLNSDMIETMHPSDSRMHEWLRTFTVGQQDIGYFPMAIFKDVGPVTVRWALSSSQLGARTLEIGVTLACKGSPTFDAGTLVSSILLAVVKKNSEEKSTDTLMPGILKRPAIQYSQSPRPQKKTRNDGLSFIETPTETDPLWTNIDEHTASRNSPSSGPPPNLLARALTRPCYPASNALLQRDNAYYHCIASSVCGWKLKAWDWSLPCIYKHATCCRALCEWKPELFQSTQSALADKVPGGFHATAADSNVGSPTSEITTTARQFSLSNPFSRYNHHGDMLLLEQLDHALLNPEYTPPNSTYIRDQLIPAKAQRAVLHMREYLQGKTNITDRHTFLYQADIFYGSHNAGYIQDILEQVIKEIGPHRIASVVSDNAGPTKKGRRETSKRYPWILNLADPIHKFNLCIQDICRDPLWDESLKQLCKLLTHFKMSTYAAGRLKEARMAKGILRNLQSIGNTQFATLYYAATSVLDNLPALYRISRNGEINTKGTPLPSIVADVLDETTVVALKFRQDLKELVNILEPFARAIVSLESIHRFRNVSIYAASSAGSRSIDDPNSAHSSTTSLPQRLNKHIFERIRKQLLSMLKVELEVAEDVPDHVLRAHSEDALLAKQMLLEQLDQYRWADRRPLPQHLAFNQSPIHFWHSQKQFEHTFILAYLAEKLFLVLPNSMCDERAGSRLTHLYSKLRTRLDANSMIEQIQFMQWESLVNGSRSRQREKKLPSMFRFSDLPQDLVPSSQSSQNLTKLTAALGDECGDEWLDRNPSDNVSESITRNKDPIDLTSEALLALFAPYTSLQGNITSSNSRLVAGDIHSEGVRIEPEISQRPHPTIINGWTGPGSPLPTQPDSRGVTRGTWRGNNTRYIVSIPSGVLISSAVNVMAINVISGSAGTYSPNIVIDAVRLY
ncbi:hypothetical protein B0J17DRAFT_718240 [Rhizoctonia solani]|nr:hypothetical protein B0J17DRAFT_718240 [Rhizoctonia solani]